MGTLKVGWGLFSLDSDNDLPLADVGDFKPPLSSPLAAGGGENPFVSFSLGDFKMVVEGAGFILGCGLVKRIC